MARDDMKITGARELDRVLKRLPYEMRQKELEGALMTAGNVPRRAFMAAAAARPRNIRMGVLERAKSVERKRIKKSQFSAEVAVGWFRRGFYAVFEEERNPFARPAWDGVARETMDALGKALGQRLDRAAKKLAGITGRQRRR